MCKDRGLAYADTFADTTDELLRLLLLIDYSKGYFFISLGDRIVPVVREALKQKNVELTMDDWNLKYFLPKEKALQFNVQ